VVEVTLHNFPNLHVHVHAARSRMLKHLTQLCQRHAGAASQGQAEVSRTAQTPPGLACCRRLGPLCGVAPRY